MDYAGVLQMMFFGNSGQDILIFLGFFIGLFLLFVIFDKIIVGILKRASRRTKFEWDDAIINFIGGIGWPFYMYVGLYIASRKLFLSKLIDRIFYVVLVLFVGFYAAKGLVEIIECFKKRYIRKGKQEEKLENSSMINVLAFITKFVVWIVLFLFVLSNLDVEITPLIASLGVGGVAIALALQEVLKDLFSAFAIYFDKPFKEGDFIIIGEDMGVVKKIGIKTTRIETLQGQELVVSNSELTNTRINNYKQMQKRRIVFGFGVTYNTNSKKMKKINDIVKKIFKKVNGADLDRCHFKEFGDFSLNYEVVYYVETGDYNKYMDIQQEINFELKESFEKEKIEFAFPTQSIYLEK